VNESEKKPQAFNFNVYSLVFELGYTIAIPIVVLALLGRYADKAWGTGPWMLLLGVVVSIVISSALVHKKVAGVLKSQTTNSKSQTISDEQNSNRQNKEV
jgi:F0F1-type ATP synthase assembly protein I